MKTNSILRSFVFSLLLKPLAALAVIETWDGGGGDNNLSTDANWFDNSAPTSSLANTDLVFAGLVRLSPNVSGLAFSARSITFDNTAGAFTTSGLQFNLGAGGLVNNDTQTMTFANLVNFNTTATSTINAASGGFAFANSVVLPADTLTVTGGFATSFGNITGNTALTKEGSGTMTWSPSAATAFDLTINSGTLSTGADGNIDVFNISSVIAVNGTSVFNINENLTLDGAQLTRALGAAVNIASGKTLTVQGGGDATITGLYSFNNASTITVTGAGSTFSTTSDLMVNQGGTLNILLAGGVSSGTLGIGRIGNGTVTVDGAGSSLTSAGVRLGTSGNTGSLTFTNSSTGNLGDAAVDESTGVGTSGLLSIQSGSSVTASSLLIAPSAVVNTGTVTVTGADTTLTLSGAAAATIGASNSSTGTLNVNSSAVFNSGTGNTVVNNTGTIAISGGGRYVSNGNLTLNGGQLTRTNGGLFFPGAGTTVTVQSGGDLIISGAFPLNDSATINVTGTGSTLSTTSTLSFNGGSALNISDGADVTSNGTVVNIGTIGSGAATVDGAGSTLAGANILLGATGTSGSLAFTNASSGTFAGILLANSAGGGGSGTLSIVSDAEVTGTFLSVATTSVANTGTVNISGTGSTLTLNTLSPSVIGAASTSSATVNLQNGAVLNNNNLSTTVNATGLIAIAGGTYNSARELTLNGGQLTRDTTGNFNLASNATLTIQSGGDAIISGAYNTGTSNTIGVTGAGSTFSASTILTIGGGSAMNILAGGNLTSGFAFLGAASGNGTVTIDGAGSSFTSLGLAVGQSGTAGSLTFSNGSAGAFTSISVDATNSASTVGTLNIQSGSIVGANTLDVANQAAANSGTVLITGPGSALNLSGVSTIGAASASSGTVTVADGGTLATGAGTTIVNATGALNINNGGKLIGPADFGGTGQINLAGFFEPGTVSGVDRTTSVSFAQNMIFQPTTGITLEIGGTTAGTQHDQLVFNGSGATHVTWNGVLNVLLINGFIPQAGNTFDLFNFDPARDAGAFSNINLPALPQALFWRTDQFYVDGTIRVSATAGTFAEWQSSLGVGAFDKDDDADGVPNGIEFLLGTNPKASGKFPIAELTPATSATDVTASVTFDIPVDPASDAHYRVRASSDLTNWTTIASKDGAGPWTGTATVTTGAAVIGLTPITVAETLPLGTTHRFHRLEGEAP